jgi:acetylornithine deacetylase
MDFVAAYLAGHGIPFVLLPNATGDKAALYATIGPMVDGGIVLSGHTDVVPVEGQPWSSDPFTLREQDGKLYGRGSCDMKGFDAICLALAPELARLPLARPIHLLLSYDEETTCLGVMDAIAAMGTTLPRPRAVIVGEPTSMEVADAHKGVATYFTRVRGFEVHSSAPDKGANAILGAVSLIGELRRMAAELRAAGDPTGRFDPAHTTLHVGTIAGGTARNITARDCMFHWEIRPVPGVDYRDIPARLQRFADEVVVPELTAGGATASVTTEEEIDVPGLAPEPGSEAEVIAFRAGGRNRTVTVAYGSEAGRFQRAGIPTVLCGPGDIAQAHQPDEFITLEQMAAGERVIRAIGAMQTA